MRKTTLAIDIGSSKVVAVLAKNDSELNINILGTGISNSSGIFKGAISNIEEATTCVNYAISLAKKTYSEEIDNTIVSISSKNSKSIRSSGSINIPNGIVTETEINQVLQMAIYNASIIPEYEVINAIPIYFRIDDMEIKNPLNINGTRLEVFVYIITAKKTTITNLRTVLKDVKTNSINFVVDGYASSLALLNEHQKNFGTSIINLGSTTTEIACFKNSSLLFNGFIPIGSNNITNDLSIMLHTPTHTAEKIKLDYISLIKDYSADEKLNKPKIIIPRIADEESNSEIGLDYMQTIIHARVEEILILARNQLKKSTSLENSNSGILITGGMANLGGIKELASKVFDGLQVSIAYPKNLKNGYLDFSSPIYSTIVGLLYYGLDSTRVYQLDSNKILVRPIRIEVIKQPTIDTANKPTKESSKPDVLTPIPRPSEKLGQKIWKKIIDAF